MSWSPVNLPSWTSSPGRMLVVGTPINEPSVYMRKALSVEPVMLSTAQFPPPSNDDRVTIPVISSYRIPRRAPPESQRYRVIAAVILTDDLSDRLNLGPIYTASNRTITIVMHGEELAMDQPPILGNGRTLVPLRAIGAPISTGRR